ncbi:hypothetical protein U27_00655 [Candidatus Vecturithrix granuli]|uniref:Uncharacterized protein n=1 Tax=Vecturithrix granuli TaxID=1499967 RepID=A0A081C852_VECG1|nr:hypothetical protein U27_00655 [Candidatus Vecturithrix granuli]
MNLFWRLGFSVVLSVYAFSAGFSLFSLVYASPLPPQFALFHQERQILFPHWNEQGAFANVLRKDVQRVSLAYNEEHVIRKFTFQLTTLTEKLSISFTPKIIIKPFILIEELQDLLLVYHSRRSRDTIPINENFQMRRLSLANAAMQVKKILEKRSNRSLSVCPYYHSIYGLHLQILW